jgi:hypothetical protein
MIVNISFIDNKDENNKIIGFIANFNATEGEYNSSSSVAINLDNPVDSLSNSERLKKIDMNSTIKSLKNDLINKGANITKMIIQL